MENGVQSSSAPQTNQCSKQELFGFFNPTVYELPSWLRMQTLDACVAELQFSPASVNLSRPGELKWATPCERRSLFPLRDVFWTEAEAGHLRSQRCTCHFSVFSVIWRMWVSWHYVAVCAQTWLLARVSRTCVSTSGFQNKTFTEVKEKIHTRLLNSLDVLLWSFSSWLWRYCTFMIWSKARHEKRSTNLTHIQ